MGYGEELVNNYVRETEERIRRERGQILSSSRLSDYLIQYAFDIPSSENTHSEPKDLD
jgi:hypothetical protein